MNNGYLLLNVTKQKEQFDILTSG